MLDKDKNWLKTRYLGWEHAFWSALRTGYIDTPGLGSSVDCIS